MEVAISLFGPVFKVFKAVRDLTKEHKGIGSDLRIWIDFLEKDMEFIDVNIVAYEEQMLQELAYEIEDFMHSLTSPGPFGFFLTALGMNPQTGELETIKEFKRRIEKLETKRQTSQRGEAKASGTTSGSSSINHDIVLVGNAKSEFEELRSTIDPTRLGVISIVGCRGLGKTALARAVYKEASVVPGGFHCKAWVVASEYKGNFQGLLKKILEEICEESEASGSSSLVRRPVTTTQETVNAALQNKRYFVVIDDILDKELRDNLKSAFPNSDGSIIVVTTSIQPIATYVGRHQYTMPYLDIDSSRQLLHETVGNLPRRPIVDEDVILKKCDGIPLTLVSVATHLRRNLGDRNCSSDVAKSLGTHIARNETFGDLKRALVDCYDSLPGHQERMCLLSVSMFPQGRQINMRSLVRKWIAEGLVAAHGQHDAIGIAYNSSKEFLERSIIDPVLICNNSDVKTCQVNGTMLEFIVYKSTCATNFATIIQPHGRLPTDKGRRNAIRRLFVCKGGMEEGENAGVIRWLTLCLEADSFNLSKCSLVRVLDLASYMWVDRKVLHNICSLLLVKYLSLRDTDVSEIPKEIEKLVNLETLDIRGTKVSMLPINVAMMPGLVHLFGQFQLVSHWPESTVEKAARMFKERSARMVKTSSSQEEHKKVKYPSKLETLAGVIMDKDGKCFRQIMFHLQKLKKVKVLCNKIAATDLIPEKKLCGDEFLESLSVKCSEPIRLLSGEFLESLSVPCAIKSLKLTGELEGLPATPEDMMQLDEDTLSNKFIKLKNVKELQLFSTGRRWKHLSVLQKMDGLLYLKLAEGHHPFDDDIFVVQKEGFRDLDRLCIQAPRLPKVHFKEGAMPWLTSLELLQTAEPTTDLVVVGLWLATSQLGLGLVRAAL